MIGGADVLCLMNGWLAKTGGIFSKGWLIQEKTNPSNQGLSWDSLCGQQGRAGNSTAFHPFPWCVSVKTMLVFLVLAAVLFFTGSHRYVLFIIAKRKVGDGIITWYNVQFNQHQPVMHTYYVVLVLDQSCTRQIRAWTRPVAASRLLFDAPRWNKDLWTANAKYGWHLVIQNIDITWVMVGGRYPIHNAASIPTRCTYTATRPPTLEVEVQIQQLFLLLGWSFFPLLEPWSDRASCGLWNFYILAQKQQLLPSDAAVKPIHGPWCCPTRRCKVDVCVRGTLMGLVSPFAMATCA